MKYTLLISLLFCGLLNAQDEIVQFKLDPRIIHTVNCHERDSGVTTVVFPSEISAVYSARVDIKYNKEKPNPFLLSFTEGNPHFTIKSLAKAGIKGAINVIHEKRVYVIHLATTSKGHSSVTFIKPKAPLTGSRSRIKSVTPSLLLSMLDKAKAYHLFKAHYPAQIEGLEYDKPNTIMEYSTHQILLKEVIRFHLKDTIFFHLRIKNKSHIEILYNPQDFAINVGDRIFYSAIADANGKVPGQGTTTAWFAITGTKLGGRNNLSVKNDWKVLLNTSQVPSTSKASTAKKDVTPTNRAPVSIGVVPELQIEEKKND